MVKIDFPLPTDDELHRYCIICHAEGAVQVHKNGRTYYHCQACGQTDGRAIYFKDQVFWLDDQQELWHAGGGVFVRNQQGKFLFFMRTEYPFAFTVPGGHLDKGEDPETTARRELKEETGLTAAKLIKVIDEAIPGDSCSGGADYHYWHGYVSIVPNQSVIINEEGEQPVWLSLDQALQKELTMPVRWIIERYAPQLQSVN